MVASIAEPILPALLKSALQIPEQIAQSRYDEKRFAIVLAQHALGVADLPELGSISALAQAEESAVT